MDILRDIIYIQNFDLLQRIADDMYNEVKDKDIFIQTYHKKNFTFLHQEKKDRVLSYTKKLRKCVK
jgi:hypothetical protein